MTVALVTLELLAFAVGVPLRIWVQRRRTGHTGVALDLRSTSPAERVTNVLLGLAFVALAVGNVVAVIDGDTPSPLRFVVAAALLLAGGAVTSWAQFAMGASWRIGVDRGEVTALVTSGPFAVVRNPIYTAMVTVGLGIAVGFPSVLTIVGLAAMVAGLELQVRNVEEPFLRDRHGHAFADWAAQAGRFAPGLGRLPTSR